MAAATSNKSKMSLRLMVHKEEKRVIFAEADSNFVDTLFSFMSLPLGTIVRLIEKRLDEKVKALGSLRNVYESLKNLPDTYLSTEESKFVMLNLRSSLFDHCRKLKLNIDDTDPPECFSCSRCRVPYFSTCNFARCSRCGSLMSREIIENSSTSSDDEEPAGLLEYSVFVSNLTTYIVTDDLRVRPNTSGLVIKLFRKYGITNSSHIEEKTFDVDHEHILMLLNAALVSKHPLTYMVFARTIYVKQESLDHHLIDKKQGIYLKNMTLKVSLQESTSKFLFAEADSDFVDFVFGFLEIPLGTVIGQLLNGTSSLQNMDNLYASISNKHVGKCIKSENLKGMLLEPKLVMKYLSKNQFFSVSVSSCSCSYETSSDEFDLKDARVEKSYLKRSAKFLLTDDLTITPLSLTSTLALLSKLKVPIGDVKEHKVAIGIKEGLKILKASLNSATTLTDALVEEIVKNKK